MPRLVCHAGMMQFWGGVAPTRGVRLRRHTVSLDFRGSVFVEFESTKIQEEVSEQVGCHPACRAGMLCFRQGFSSSEAVMQTSLSWCTQVLGKQLEHAGAPLKLEPKTQFLKRKTTEREQKAAEKAAAAAVAAAAAEANGSAPAASAAADKEADRAEPAANGDAAEPMDAVRPAHQLLHCSDATSQQRLPQGVL